MNCSLADSKIRFFSLLRCGLNQYPKYYCYSRLKTKQFFLYVIYHKRKKLVMHFITMDSVTEKYTNIWDNVIIMVLYLPGKAERFLMTPFLTHD